jgi:predicted molibdopterin-dependent oxidoreductase YjgC
LSRTVDIELNGRTVRVAEGISVAAALLNAGEVAFRTSVGGERRGPLCGMGICYECRANIDGVAHQRTCLEPVRPGMRVVTGE